MENYDEVIKLQSEINDNIATALELLHKQNQIIFMWNCVLTAMILIILLVK